MKTEKGAAATGKPMEPKKSTEHKPAKETAKPGAAPKQRPGAK